MKTNTESTEYTIDYFIKKFEAIPENEIGRNSLSNHCALWHCGVRNEEGRYKTTPESNALAYFLNLVLKRDFISDNIVYVINDNLRDTPKNNILNVLKKVKSSKLWKNHQ